VKRAAPVALWIGAMALCAWVALRATYSADLTAFLPRAASESQALMLDELRDGVAARLVLVALEGAPDEALAATSRELANELRRSPAFAYVANGSDGLSRRDRDLLFAHRYLLSPGVTAAAFSEAKLREALAQAADLLASPAGTLLRPTLPRDPTGELPRLLAAHADRRAPGMHASVWFDAERGRALLMLETRAAGDDLDAQAAAHEQIMRAFTAARTHPDVRLLVSGPGVFGVRSRAAIEHDAWRLSLLATVGVALVLLAAYRRPALVALGAVPVATGLLAGVAAVAAVFGKVHGITLGFGATLVGEAADYSTYLLAQRMRGEALAATAARVWPTLRLAVLTTVFGSLAMLASSFAGLAQLGLLAFTGALAAGIATRYVLPALVGAGGPPAPEVPAPAMLRRGLAAMQRLAWAVPLAFLVALAVLVFERGRLWENELARLAPIPLAEQRRDQELRDALGAPDVRYLLVATGASAEDVLQRLETLVPALDALVAAQALAGYDAPVRYLPSVATQQRRQAALPEPAALAVRLDAAVSESPFRAGFFAPFVADVATARAAAPLRPADLEGSAFGAALAALLRESAGRWIALVPLAGVADPARLATLSAHHGPGLVFLDLKAESDDLVNAYRAQSLALAGAGVLVIALVLAVGLRSARAVVRVLLPVLAALAATAAALVLAGVRLSQLHLVSLLLVLGIGTNYSLFFARPVVDVTERLRNAYAVLVATATTLIAFGALAASTTPVLGAIGRTVVLGAALSLVFAAAWSQRDG
jgi:predicted exporter